MITATPTTPPDADPAYLRLGLAELRERARRAVRRLADCRLCPRDCGVNRLEDSWSACKTGRHAVVSSHFPHFGEEDCLRGWNGSGTIFFAHCNLRCVFCQNHAISQDIKPGRTAEGSTAAELSGMMLELQDMQCHNINLVTPEHVVPQVLEAVAEAAGRGLRLPLVYNTSAYDGVDSLRLLDGIVDIYMPDIKFWSADRSRRYMKASDYPEVARSALREMDRQVGPLTLDRHGLATRGLLIRHLVMPGMHEETRAILEWVARELGPDTYVNLMDQYRPDGGVPGDPSFREIDLRLPAAEYRAARETARSLGLRLDRRARVRPGR